MILLCEVSIVWMVIGQYQSVIVAAKFTVIYTVSSVEIIIAVIKWISLSFGVTVNILCELDS